MILEKVEISGIVEIYKTIEISVIVEISERVGEIFEMVEMSEILIYMR